MVVKGKSGCGFYQTARMSFTDFKFAAVSGKRNLSGRITRDLYRECSGGKSRNTNGMFVRSTFDKAVCSEPLATSGVRCVQGGQKPAGTADSKFKRGGPIDEHDVRLFPRWIEEVAGHAAHGRRGLGNF